jgi:5-methylthioadenosine/S-adenosylhomocysteine deaminase
MSEGLEKSAGLAADLEGHPRMSVALAPHAPYSVDEAGLAAVAELARERQLRVAMHVLEADFERPRSLEYYGKGPLQRLQGHGLLGPDFMAVHMVQLRDDDIDCLVETGTHVIHCPESNLKLGNGACRVADLLDAGVNVALGTDGAASNNDLDMLGEARTAALLAKGMSGRPDALDAWQTLEMMTLSGARALGLGDEIGTIEVGKSADLCAIDLDDPSTQPLHSVPSQVVYSAAARQVSHVWVAGNALLDNHELTTIDLAEQMANAQAWQKRLANP